MCKCLLRARRGALTARASLPGASCARRAAPAGSCSMKRKMAPGSTASASLAPRTAWSGSGAWTRRCWSTRQTPMRGTELRLRGRGSCPWQTAWHACITSAEMWRGRRGLGWRRVTEPIGRLGDGSSSPLSMGARRARATDMQTASALILRRPQAQLAWQYQCQWHHHQATPTRNSARRAAKGCHCQAQEPQVLPYTLLL